MGLLHADMLAELQQATPQVCVVMRVTLGDGTVLRWTSSKHGAVSSLTDGLYEARVKRFGSVRREIARREGTPKPAVLDIEVDDVDGEV